MKGLFGNFNLGGIGDSIQNLLGGGQANSNQNNQNNQNNQGSKFGMGSMLGATAVGGLLGALFTGDKTKDFAGSALKYGGTAALGALALNFYQKWSQKKAGANQNQQVAQSPVQNQVAAPTQNPEGIEMNKEEEQITLILLEAMIFAARADGHIDEQESATIQKTAATLFPDQEMSSVINGFLNEPVDPVALAAKVDDPEEARDLYRLSCVALKIDSYMERTYLDGLAKALTISDEEKFNLEKEALQIQEAMQNS